jgi:hypothetical protein
MPSTRNAGLWASVTASKLFAESAALRFALLIVDESVSNITELNEPPRGQGLGLVRAQIVSCANHDRRNDEGGNPDPDQSLGAAPGLGPLMEGKSPKRAEDDDTCHMQGPARERIRAHLALAHGVKEKLEIPRRARDCAKQIILEQRWRVARTDGARTRRTDEFFRAAIDDQKIQAPDEIGREAADQHHAKYRKSLTQLRCAGGKGQGANRRAGI